MQLDHILWDYGVPTIEILQMYGHRVHNGHYSKQSSVRADLVATVWRAVAETHLLEGLFDLQKSSGSASKDFNKRFLQMTRRYSYVVLP